MITPVKRKKTSILITCTDVRHDGKIGDAIRYEVGTDCSFHIITEPGGSGVLTSVFPEALPWLLKKIRLIMHQSDIEAIYLTLHGPSPTDMHGCDAYLAQGFADQHHTPEACREFSRKELHRAADRLRKEGIAVPIHAFYGTFDSRGENVVEQILIP